MSVDFELGTRVIQQASRSFLLPILLSGCAPDGVLFLFLFPLFPSLRRCQPPQPPLSNFPAISHPSSMHPEQLIQVSPRPNNSIRHSPDNFFQRSDRSGFILVAEIKGRAVPRFCDLRPASSRPSLPTTVPRPVSTCSEAQQPRVSLDKLHRHSYPSYHLALHSRTARQPPS